MKKRTTLTHFSIDGVDLMPLVEDGTIQVGEIVPEAEGPRTVRELEAAIKLRHLEVTADGSEEVM